MSDDDEFMEDSPVVQRKLPTRSSRAKKVVDSDDEFVDEEDSPVASKGSRATSSRARAAKKKNSSDDEFVVDEDSPPVAKGAKSTRSRVKKIDSDEEFLGEEDSPPTAARGSRATKAKAKKVESSDEEFKDDEDSPVTKPKGRKTAAPKSKAKAKKDETADSDEIADKPAAKGRKPAANPKPRLLKKDKYDVMCIVIDVGSSMGSEEDGGSAITLAKEAIDWVLSRKIFTHARVRVMLVQSGIELEPDMLKEREHRYVAAQDEVFQPVNFDQLRYLNQEVVLNPNRTGDIIDGIIMGAEQLRQGVEDDLAVENKYLFVVTNGRGETQHKMENIRDVANGLKAIGAELIVMGIDGESSSGRHQCVPLLQDLVQRVDGTAYSFKSAMSAVNHFSASSVESRAIRKNWEIGPGLRLPLAMFTNTAKAANPLKSVLVDEHGEQVHKEARLVRHNRPDMEDYAAPLAHIDEDDDGAGARDREEYSAVAQEDVVSGYLFGSTPISISAEDEAAYKNHNFNEGEVRGSMKLIQFARMEYLQIPYLVGTKSFVVLPGWEKTCAERDSHLMKTTIALIRSMKERGVFAVCRYAYNVSFHIHLMGLIPHVDEETNTAYMTAVRLPFYEDVRPISFPDLGGVEPTDHQVQLIDDLIDSMQLPTDPEPVLNPFFQRECAVMKQKALNKLNKIGSEDISPSIFLKRSLEPDPKLMEIAAPIFEMMKDVDRGGFNIQEVQKVKKPRKLVERENILDLLAEVNNKAQIMEVKKEEPEDEPVPVKKAQKPMQTKPKAKARPYIEKVREQAEKNFDCHVPDLLSNIWDDFISKYDGTEEKQCLLMMAAGFVRDIRIVSVEMNRPDEYNNWLIRSLVNEDWKEYMAENSGVSLITTKDCPTSKISVADAVDFWTRDNEDNEQWIVKEEEEEYEDDDEGLSD